MFYTVIPTAPPMFAVQPNSPAISSVDAKELLEKLERHFMVAVALVSWDEAGQFRAIGHPCPEILITDEDLTWREFELPDEDEVPF